jgi:Protein of unknown function (DUF3575)
MTLTKWILGSLLLCGPLLAYAQKKTITLSWLPTSFMELDGGFTAGIEYRFSKRLALLNDAGIIFLNPNNSNEENSGRDGILGYKIKPEIRWYFKNRSKHPNDGGFVALEGIYKHVNYQRFDGLPVFDNLGNLAYTYFGGYRIIKDVYGAAVKFGYRRFFGPKYKVGLELYLGLGSRQKNFALRDLPPGGSFDREFFGERFFNIHWREGNIASMPAGFKLLWRIR